MQWYRENKKRAAGALEAWDYPVSLKGYPLKSGKQEMQTTHKIPQGSSSSFVKVGAHLYAVLLELLAAL